MPPADALHHAPQEKHAPHEKHDHSRTSDHTSNLNAYRLARSDAHAQGQHDEADEVLPKLSLHNDGNQTGESSQFDELRGHTRGIYLDDGVNPKALQSPTGKEATLNGGTVQSDAASAIAQPATTDAPTPTATVATTDSPTPTATATTTDAPTPTAPSTAGNSTAQRELTELNVIGQEINVLDQQFNLLEQQFVASENSGSSTTPTSDNPAPPPTPAPANPPTIDAPSPTPTTPPTSDNPSPPPTPAPANPPTIDAPTPAPTTPPTSDNPTPAPTTPPTSDNPTPAPTTPTTTPTTTSTTSGPHSSLGPNGEVAGSTASTFGVSAMPAVSEAAQAFYVSADGSTTGNGSKENPFSTLQQAQKAMENSTIKTTYVEGGTYKQSSALNLTSADSGESFIGIGGSSNPAILDGGGTTGSIISINGADNLTVEGMQLQNTQKNLFSWTSADAAITANNSSGDNFSYNNIQNVGEAYSLGGVTNSKFDGNEINDVQQAMAFNPGSSGNTIDSNSITNVTNVTGGNDVGAINLDAATNSTISNNYVENTQEAGIELANWGGASPTGNSIVGNTIINSNTAATPSSTYDATGTNPADMGAIYAWQGAGNASVNMNLNIANNYIKNSGAGYENVGIYLDDGVSGASVTGNHVESGGSGWSILLHGGSNDTVKNNIVNLTSSTGKERGVLMQSDGPQMTNDTISNNTFYASGANGGAYTDYSNPSANIPKTIADNTYSGVTQANFDSGPVTQTVQYVDPEAGNYSLVGSSGSN